VHSRRVSLTTARHLAAYDCYVLHLHYEKIIVAGNARWSTKGPDIDIYWKRAGARDVALPSHLKPPGLRSYMPSPM